MKKLYPTLLLFLVLLIGTFFITPAFSQSGSNDATFNTTDQGFGLGDGANNYILTTAIQSDGKIIIGGYFTTYNGTAQSNIARLNSDGTLDAGFNTGTGANNIINSSAIQTDGKIIISGSFTFYNGTAISRIARLNIDGTLDAGFNPGIGANNIIRTTAIQSNGKIIIGGDFTDYNGTGRNRIARLNSDGTLDAGFDPGTGAGGTIHTTAIQSDGKTIIGGFFTAYNGTGRNRIARLNSDGTLDAGFNPNTGANNIIQTTAIQSDGKILIGGDFTSYNGTARNLIARLNSDGTLDAGFDPGTGANSTIFTASLQSDGKIIIGGGFTFFNGMAINRIARLNADGTIDASFNTGTGANNIIYTTAIQSDGKIIIGGSFTTNIARLNSDGTLDAGFNSGTGANSFIRTITIQSDGKIIIGGDFSSYNGTGRNRIARLNSDGTLDAGFNPGTGANSLIRTITIQSDGKIIIGGFFTAYNGTPRNSIARLNNDGTLDAGFNPGGGANGAIFTTAIQSDGKIIIGGLFTDYNGTSRNYIARLNSDGTLDAGFNPGTGANNTIQTTSIQNDGKIIIGGDFNTYNGTARSNIARLNSDGTLDAGFDPGSGANGTIRTTAIQSDGKIIIGGDFTTYNSTARNRIARLNSDGTLDAGFNSATGANDIIFTTAIQSDGKIIIGGNFTNYNGSAINRIARLNTDGTLDAGFNPGTGANNSIRNTAIQSDGKIIICGFFTAYNGTGRNKVARVLSSFTVVPLRLISFSGNHTSSDNILQWQTANEINTINFVVEKSANGNSFTGIATLAAQGAGAGNYTYTDAKQTGIVYYRLKMVDADGKFTYSNIIRLSVNNKLRAEVFPNPSKDFITVTVDNILMNKYAALIDMQGVQLQSLKINSQSFTINISDYPSGIYLLKIEGAETMKIVKE